jgi:molecular chaperone DnaJ
MGPQRRLFSSDFREYRDMDLYRVLQVSKEASKEDIKQAYYELAKRYHPDSGSKEQGEAKGERFQLIQMAYEVLSNEERRLQYDTYRGRTYYENQYEGSE